MKAYYKINGEKVTQMFLETYDKLADINLDLFTEQECVMNGELVVQPDSLKVVNGVMVAKTALEIYTPTIAQNKAGLKAVAMQYSILRVDTYFASLLEKATATCVKCQAVNDWVNNLWGYYYTVKAQIESAQSQAEYSEIVVDFEQFGEEPYSYGECKAELDI